MKNVLSMLTIAGCMLISVNAMAGDPLSLPSGSHAQASKHNEEGITLFKAGKYEEALKHFDASEDIERTPQVYFNEGLAYDQLGKTGRARMHFQEAQRMEQEMVLHRLNSPISNAEVLKKYHLLKK